MYFICQSQQLQDRCGLNMLRAEKNLNERPVRILKSIIFHAPPLPSTTTHLTTGICCHLPSQVLLSLMVAIFKLPSTPLNHLPQETKPHDIFTYLTGTPSQTPVSPNPSRTFPQAQVVPAGSPWGKQLIFLPPLAGRLQPILQCTHTVDAVCPHMG